MLPLIHDARLLLPRTHRVSAFTNKVAASQHTHGLQPPSHTVAASINHGCSLDHIRLQARFLGVFPRLVSSAHFWLAVPLVPLAALLPDIVSKAYIRTYAPETLHLGWLK